MGQGLATVTQVSWCQSLSSPTWRLQSGLGHFCLQQKCGEPGARGPRKGALGPGMSKPSCATTLVCDPGLVPCLWPPICTGWSLRHLAVLSWELLGGLVSPAAPEDGGDTALAQASSFLSDFF